MNYRVVAVGAALVGLGFLLGWPTWWKIVVGIWLVLVIVVNAFDWR